MTFSFTSRSWALAAAFAVLSTAPGLAGSFGGMGDGSDTTNPELLTGPGSCPNCALADEAQDYNDPFFDIDWSVALRGGYVDSSTGSRFEGTILPSVTVSNQGLRTSFSLTGSAEITRSTVEQLRITALRLSAAAEYEVDALTKLSGTGNLSLTQAAPDAPGNLAGVETSPLVVAGDGHVAVTRDAGFLDVTLRGDVGRTIVGATTMTGGAQVDNTWQNDTMVGGGLRLGHKLTPGLTAFVDANASYDRFDAVSPSLLVKLDGPTYTVKTGLSAKWNSVLDAEASVGLGLRRFDVGLADVLTPLYDLRVGFRPDETLAFNGTFGTAITSPGNTGGSARVVYSATLDAAYKVNPWVALRASAGASYAETVGTGGVETGYNFGVGSDFAISDHTALTADYTFEHSATATAVINTHKWMLGVKFSK